MVKQRHIIALGGGGFSETPDNPLLDRYIFRQAKKKHPQVCFIPTASGDADKYIEKFYAAMKKRHPAVHPSHLSLFKPKSIAKLVEAADIFYVGGGNTINLLILWRAWGLDAMLREAYEQGKIMCGISAGGNCWFEQFLTDSTGKLTMSPGLGWLPGSFSPHYDREKKRAGALRREIKAGAPEGFACDNDAAIHFINEKPHAFISSRKAAHAYTTKPTGAVKQKTKFLG